MLVFLLTRLSLSLPAAKSAVQWNSTGARIRCCRNTDADTDAALQVPGQRRPGIDSTLTADRHVRNSSRRERPRAENARPGRVRGSFARRDSLALMAAKEVVRVRLSPGTEATVGKVPAMDDLCLERSSHEGPNVMDRQGSRLLVSLLAGRSVDGGRWPGAGRYLGRAAGLAGSSGRRTSRNTA